MAGLNGLEKTRINTHTDLLDLYWREIKDNEPLDRGEEVELFSRVRAGDQEAVETLVKANLRFVVSVARDYCQEDGPVMMDLIAEGNMGPERLHNALEAGVSDMSLDASVFEDEDTALMAILPAEEAGVDGMEEEALMQTLQESLGVLSERESLIVQSYFGLNGAETRTLEQIGQEMGVTRERVRQLRNRALDKMRARYGDLLLELSAN